MTNYLEMIPWINGLGESNQDDVNKVLRIAVRNALLAASQHIDTYKVMLNSGMPPIMTLESIMKSIQSDSFINLIMNGTLPEK